MNITDREYAAMEICLNYEDRDTQLIDNYSNGGCDEFMAKLGLSRHQAAQLCGSLEEKGLGVNDGNQGNGHIMWLTDAGVNAIFDRRESK